MRIAISTSPVRGSRKEGLGVYLDNLLRELQEVDGSNEYFVFMPQSHRNGFDIHAANFSIVSMPDFAHHSEVNVLWHLSVYPLLLKRLHIDVLHLPEIRRIPAVKVCPTVMTIHDMVNVKIKGRVRGLRYLYYVTIIRYLPKVVDEICVVSGSTFRDVSKVIGQRDIRISLVYNGVSDRFKPRPRRQAFERLAKYDVPRKSILCVSRLEHPQKNHVTLLRAFAYLKQRRRLAHKLLLVGMRWTGHEVVLREIKRLNLDDDVKLYDYVPNEDLPFFYNVANFSVYPSLYEGFGLPVLEAMASGCPVIASNASSIPEITGNSALLFAPLDYKDLAEKIQALIDDNQLRHRLVQQGLEHASHFSWKTTAKRMVEIYERLNSS